MYGNHRISRRTWMKISSGCLAIAGLSSTAAAESESESDASIEFSHPPGIDTDFVTVSLTVSEDLADEVERVRVFTEEDGRIESSPLGVRAPTDTKLQLHLERTLEEEETVYVALLPTGGYRSIEDAEADAFAAVTADTENIDVVDGKAMSLVDADSDAGFNYPYLLYAPDLVDPEEESPVFVEPNNTGETSDDLDVHREAAEQRISSIREYGDVLETPVLVPVFPRPSEDPVDWRHYTHALDDTSLAIEGGDLERIDLQLLAMVDHARELLADEGYPVADEGILLNGFSASGNFVDRFAVLHADEVISVTAGGLNGMPLLPAEEVDGEFLPYHVGIADVEELTGEPVDLDAVDELNQFLYMGAEDENDTIPFSDAWTDDHLRQLALDVYGEDMIRDRFPRSQEIYQEAGVEAQFRIYEDTGHTPRPAVDDIIEFHERSIAGEDVSEFGEDLQSSLKIEYTPKPIRVGNEIEFDASESHSGVLDISEYLWEFGDDGSAVGKQVTHEFEEAGEYEVSLRVIYEDGSEKETEQEVTVKEMDECFIATAAEGSKDHEHVVQLRSFRDATLQSNRLGDLFIRTYYRTSPPIAEWIGRSDRRRKVTRRYLVRPLSRAVAALGLTDSEMDG